MADKSTQLVLTALTQAAAIAEGLPLHGGKASPGLFPSNSAGKQAAQRCVEDGLLSRSTPGQPPTDAATAKKTKVPPECYTLTEKGFTYLVGQVSPRQVLQDLVRVLETRQGEVTELVSGARRMQAGLETLQANVQRLLQTLPGGQGENSLGALYRMFRSQGDANGLAEGAGEVEKTVRTELQNWQTAGATEDYPLPDLYRKVKARQPKLTIGQFHDLLRRLHDSGDVYLHPWTGPLYELPEPPQALLVGHEIAFYASWRTPGQTL
jgi:hypothetical protein